MTDFWSRVDKSDGCWLWLGYRMPIGYGRLRVKGRMALAHRHAWTLTYGPIPDGIDVLHRCDVRSCVRPDHLWLGTHAENMKDMSVKRRAPWGPRSGRTHLTESQVRAIRLQRGFKTQKETAEDFGIGVSTVGHIQARTRWPYLK